MKRITAIIMLAFANYAYAADTYVTGTVTSITSISEGLLLRVNGNEKPSGCSQTSSWMLIPEDKSTMITVALAMYMAGNRSAVVYVNPSAGGSYCQIKQYDPQH
ncbi:hypothetical protein P886_0184 [Alteromonadaceae bacterium 2753L.S.0a.02]|nr:hypothetical protein P886_0184 [Alteromonadaceae bacterium 2753L.S.0a.02]